MIIKNSQEKKITSDRLQTNKGTKVPIEFLFPSFQPML